MSAWVKFSAILELLLGGGGESKTPQDYVILFGYYIAYIAFYLIVNSYSCKAFY
jgi:hypothetical protein